VDETAEILWICRQISLDEGASGHITAPCHP
jgi:hypothetical protein